MDMALNFDEFAQREVIVETRLVLEDSVTFLEQGTMPCPELVRCATMLARLNEHHELLLKQMVVQETIEASARMVNKDLHLRNEALERELIRTRGMLAMAHSFNHNLLEVAYSPNMMRRGGPTPS